MIRSAGFVLAAALLAVGVIGCDPDARDEVEPLGEARQEQCGGYVVTNVVPQQGVVHFVAPQYLINSSEAWGPQTLLLAVDRRVSAQLVVHSVPGIQIEKDKLTKTLQTILGYSLTHEFDVTASSSTVVDEGWSERLEAYPAFQVLTYDVNLDTCGPYSGLKIGNGAVYRPVGVYFQVVVLVQGPKKIEDEQRRPQPGSITAMGQPVLGAEAVGITDPHDR